MHKTKCIKTWIYFVDYSYIINVAGGEGAEVVYALRNTPELANLILNNIGEAGQIKRKAYQRRLPEDPNKDYYFIIRDTGNLQSLLVEYGFVDNAKDLQKLKNNLDDYVEGVVKAIAEYTNTPYTPPSQEGNYYIVEQGDTLYKIAQKYNISVQELKELNNLKNNTINPGQKLIISRPGQQPTYGTYIIEKGDTLYGIASAYGISVQELKELNNLSTNTLYIGQELLVPELDIPTAPPLGPPETTPPETTPPTQPEIPYTIYTVEKGDSLWSISRKFNVTIPEIIELNNLTNINLQIGDKLKIPTQNGIEITKRYTVKSGDTLWSIAKENNVSVSELKSVNNLKSNLLSIGQELIIP